MSSSLCKLGCLCFVCCERRAFTDPAYNLLPRTDVSKAPPNWPRGWPWPVPPGAHAKYWNFLADSTDPVLGYRKFALDTLYARKRERTEIEASRKAAFVALWEVPKQKNAEEAAKKEADAIAKAEAEREAQWQAKIAADKAELRRICISTYEHHLKS